MLRNLGYISREGCEQYDYEITEDDFNRLGTFADDHENVELIRTAKMTYSGITGTGF